MNLAEWGGQERPLSEHLKVIESVCAALEPSHRKQLAHGGVEPSRIEVRTDGSCRVKDGSLDRSSPYAAPEIRSGQNISPKSDVYSAGVAFYEMLSGERPDSPPRPLTQVRPDLPRDLADAITACVEGDPEWRPGDLTYVAECARRLRGQPASPPARAAAGRSARPAPSFGGLASAPAAGRNAWWVVGAAVAMFAGAVAWFWFGRNPGAPSPSVAPSRPAPTFAAAPLPPPISVPSATLPNARATQAPVRPTAPPPAPATVPAFQPTPPPTTLAAAPVRPPVTTPTPGPRPTAVAANPAPAPSPVAPPPTTPPATQAPAPAATAAPAGPAALAVLSAVSPPSLKIAATGLIDIRGRGLRPDHQVRFLRGRDAAAGIHVTRQRWVDATLFQALVQVDDNAPAGSYALILVDGEGHSSNVLNVRVAR
jgi:hypothetical protein